MIPKRPSIHPFSTTVLGRRWSTPLASQQFIVVMLLLLFFTRINTLTAVLKNKTKKLTPEAA